MQEHHDCFRGIRQTVEPANLKATHWRHRPEQRCDVPFKEVKVSKSGCRKLKCAALE